MSLVDEVVRVSTPDAMSAARCAALSHGMLVRPRALTTRCDGRNRVPTTLQERRREKLVRAAMPLAIRCAAAVCFLCERH